MSPFPDRIRAFRTDRLARIASADTPIEFSENRAAVLHLLPVVSIENRSQIDISKAAEKHLYALRPIQSANVRERYNADGVLAYDDKKWSNENRRAATYVHVFRSGAIEIAGQRLLIRQLKKFDSIVPMGVLEGQFIDAVTAHGQHQKYVEGNEKPTN